MESILLKMLDTIGALFLCWFVAGLLGCLLFACEDGPPSPAGFTIGAGLVASVWACVTIWLS